MTALEDVLAGRIGPEAQLRRMRRDLACKFYKVPNDVMRPLLVGGGRRPSSVDAGASPRARRGPHTTGRSGGGRCRAVVGPFVVMNRPLLSLFANATLLAGCRDDLLRTNATDATLVYAGAAYNNDHLISHCAFSYFPRKWAEYRPYNDLLAPLSRVEAKFAYSMYMPDFHARIERPILMRVAASLDARAALLLRRSRPRDRGLGRHYNDARASAAEEVERLATGQGGRWRVTVGRDGREPIVAFHHATRADMAFLDGDEETAAGERSTSRG